MAKIVSPPAVLGDPPQFAPDRPWLDQQKLEDQWIDSVKDWYTREERINSRMAFPLGEILKFNVADGYALYLIASLKPPILVHLPIGDAYQFPYIHRLTAKDIRDEARRQKAFDDLFK